MVTTAKRGSISRNKITSSLLVGAVTSGMVVASLSTTAPANAWCVSIATLSFDSTGGASHCSSGLFSFSLTLDDTSVAQSDGIFTGAIASGNSLAQALGIFTGAWAGGDGSQSYTDGTANWSVAQGTKVVAAAGNTPTDFVNFAFNFGNAVEPPDDDLVTENGSSVVNAGFGAFNVAANLGGNATQGSDVVVLAGGSGAGAGTDVDPLVTTTAGWVNAALNLLGDRNWVWAAGGLLNAAIAFGNDSDVLVGGFSDGVDPATNDPATLSVGFSLQAPFIDNVRNFVSVRNGLLSVAGAIGSVEGPVEQNYIGVTIKTPLDNLATAKAGAAAPVQQSLAASTAKVTTPKASKQQALSGVSKSKAKVSNAVSKIKAKRAAKSTADTGSAGTE